MKRLTKADQKRHAAFSAAVLTLCQSFGASVTEWTARVPTVHGDLVITPYQGIAGPWLAIRFATFSTGRVYDDLHGRSFNGYSGKWNIHLSGGEGYADLAAATLRELERRLSAVRCPSLAAA